MRRLGAPMIIDLRAGGSAASASVVPTTSVVPQSFTAPQIKQAVGADNYPLCRGIMTKNVITFDQAAAGGSIVPWDELFRMNDSFNVNIPRFGVTHDKNVWTGPMAKHIGEFFALGYRYCDQARVNISAADGDTVVTLYTFLPFTNELIDDAEGFWPWVGWLRDMELIFSVATATTISAASTGAVSKAPTTLSAWMETYVSPQLVLPGISIFKRYLTNAAAGQNVAFLQNMGLQPDGLTAVEQGVRLGAIIELMSPLGLGGTSTGNLFTSFACPELGQDPTVNIDGFWTPLKSAIGHRGPVSTSLVLSIHDGAGDMATMVSSVDGSQFQAGAKFIPWRTMAPGARLEYLPKVAGNINLIRQFTAVPTTGVHLVITNEIRQLQASKQNELQAAAGIPMNTPRTFASSKPLRGAQTFGYGVVLQTRR